MLAAVYALHGEGYPVNISEKVNEMSGNRPMLGTVLTSLDGYFTLTLSGEKLLMRVMEASPAVARFLGDFA